MGELALVAIFLALLFFFLGSGVWVGASLMGCTIVGMVIFADQPVGDRMALTIWDSLSSWTLAALPLFIWMGEILFRTRISEVLFRGLTPLMYRLPGGLLHVNVGASAVFAAISGSSAATVATVGKMSIPELRKRKYSETMIVGTLAGAGTLGLLIPPSIALIVYGVTVNISIAKLFIAGVLPGIMLALLFMGFIAIWGLTRGRATRDDMSITFREKAKAVLDLFPVVCLIAFVIGSIYTGLATATEAAVLGVVGSLVLAAFQRSLTRDTFKASVLGAVRTSSMIAFILAGSTVLSLAMAFTGIPKGLATFISGLQLTPLVLIACLTVFYIVLGCFLDGISSIVLTMAVIEPMVRTAGFDMIWFGIYLMLVVEMAQITPPIGFNLFVLQGMTGHDIGFIAKASLPMFFIMIIAVLILVWVPEIATFLPEAMREAR